MRVECAERKKKNCDRRREFAKIDRGGGERQIGGAGNGMFRDELTTG